MIQGLAQISIGIGTFPVEVTTHTLHLQPHKYKDLSLELVPNNLIIRYFHFLELFFTYMRI